MKKEKILTATLAIFLAGCGVTYSSAWQDMQESIQKIRQSVKQSSDNFTYENKDLDLKFLETQVSNIKLAQSDLFPEEVNFGKNIFISAKLFYLSEAFERSYAEDKLLEMQEIRTEVEDILQNKPQSSGLLAELDDFILAEESYKKYLAGEMGEAKFSEMMKNAESDKLFDLFYDFIDEEVLFGSGGIDFQE